jgi:hypothetical protein
LRNLLPNSPTEIPFRDRDDEDIIGQALWEVPLSRVLGQGN